MLDAAPLTDLAAAAAVHRPPPVKSSEERRHGGVQLVNGCEAVSDGEEEEEEQLDSMRVVFESLMADLDGFSGREESEETTDSVPLYMR
jgi:hypothetical protein